MRIIHTYNCNALFQESVTILGIYEWSNEDWVAQIGKEGCYLNGDSEIEYPYNSEDEHVEVWRKMKDDEKSVCPQCNREFPFPYFKKSF